MVNSLVNGGIPADLDMSHILAGFMHMLTLNQDSMKLLKESELVKMSMANYLECVANMHDGVEPEHKYDVRVVFKLVSILAYS